MIRSTQGLALRKAVRRGQGLRLWLGRRAGGDRGLPQHQIRDPGDLMPGSDRGDCRSMADTGYSVFASYARGAPEAGGMRARNDQSAIGIRADPAGCDHRHTFALSPPPPQTHQASRMNGAGANDLADAKTLRPRRTRSGNSARTCTAPSLVLAFSTGELRQTVTRLGWRKAIGPITICIKVRLRPHDQAAKTFAQGHSTASQTAHQSVSKARTEVEVSALWRAAVKRGDIPAVLGCVAHPARPGRVCARVRRSPHAVASRWRRNRADIRRVCDLEAPQRGT